MSVTASRLGSAPLRIDWSHLSNRGPLSPDPEGAMSAWKKLSERFESGEVGFFDAPIREDLSSQSETLALARTLQQRSPAFEDCLFLGIGGSALGPISLLQALEHRRKHSLRFHFVENPDPIDWTLTLQKLDPEKTLVIGVTKSGTTFETMAQIQLSLDWLGKARWKTHFIGITDPKKGDLREFCNREDLVTLPVAPSIGGRFSAFSPVGILPMALAGLDVEAWMKGANQVRDFQLKTAPEKNPFYLLSAELIRQFDEHPIHVCMPYSTRLRSVGGWFVQLWAESLGKNRKGFTPLGAVGATDQHSILQLLRDGPDDKITLFLTIDETENPVTIPRIDSNAGQRIPTFHLLQGHSLQELLMTEYRAISRVLTNQKRPHFSIRLDRLDERSVGALYFMLCTWTAITGTLWGVDPFDQPGVEEGKVYIREALEQSRSEAVSREDAQNDVHRLRLNRD